MNEKGRDKGRPFFLYLKPTWYSGTFYAFFSFITQKNKLVLRTVKRIPIFFSFIFLIAMMFTVVAYLPLIEEEPSQTKVELKNKLATETDGDDEPSNPEFIAGHNYRIHLNIALMIGGNSERTLYYLPQEEFDTPPPKV